MGSPYVLKMSFAEYHDTMYAIYMDRQNAFFLRDKFEEHDMPLHVEFLQELESAFSFTDFLSRLFNYLVYSLYPNTDSELYLCLVTQCIVEGYQVGINVTYGIRYYIPDHRDVRHRLEHTRIIDGTPNYNP